MTTRCLSFVGATVLVIVVLAVAWLPAYAQSNRTTAASVRTGTGLVVQEVRVGASCVVVVTTDGPGAKYVAAVPCS
jgi:predicted S18 family serine protease